MTITFLCRLPPRLLKRLVFLLCAVVIPVYAGTGIPEGIVPVKGFVLERYLGTWYELARIDHFFERGLTEVTAHYSLRDDGGVKVVNRGAKQGEWKEAEGRAYFVEDGATAYLKVTFFWPFYGSYIVFDLDDEYQRALVTGPDKSYFWLLSRTPTLPPAVVQKLLDKAKGLGFDTSQLVWSWPQPASDQAIPPPAP